MVTVDWSPMQSISLVLIFFQRREQRGWLLPCFCVVGARLCQPRLQWPHLPLGTAAASPRKGLKSFSVPLQPAREPAGLMGFPGRSDVLTSSERQWMRLGQWLPGGTRGDALGSLCPASPKCNWVTGFVTVSGKSDSAPVWKGKKGIALNSSFVYNGLFFFFFNLVKLWSRGVGCHVGMAAVSSAACIRQRFNRPHGKVVLFLPDSTVWGCGAREEVTSQM